MTEGLQVTERTNLPTFYFSANKGSFSTDIWEYFSFVQYLTEFFKFFFF
jgi:hypothetical protein